MVYSKDLIKGTLKPIILKLLRDNGRMYGYQITQEVRELSKGKIEITEGALYPLLHKLEAEKIVVVEQLSSQRRGAAEAQRMYRETDESIARREAEAAARKSAGGMLERPKQRPTKKQRRQIHRFREP